MTETTPAQEAILAYLNQHQISDKLNAVVNKLVKVTLFSQMKESIQSISKPLALTTGDAISLFLWYPSI
jgi:hypothetical protein